MWVLLYVAGVLALLLGLQTAVLLAFREPLQWTFGANSQQPKSLKLALKLVLQGTLIASIFVFPYLVGTTPTRYYGPILPPGQAVYFLVGQALGVLLLALV